MCLYQAEPLSIPMMKSALAGDMACRPGSMPRGGDAENSESKEYILGDVNASMEDVIHEGGFCTITLFKLFQ